MIWDVDQYIVHDPGDVQIGPKQKFDFVSDPEYRKAARERYQAALAKQRERYMRTRNNGAKS